MKTSPSSPRTQIVILLATVLLLRIALSWVFGTEIADVSQYHGMADIVGRGENIYEIEGLFHYTPLPMFLPEWSLQAADTLKLPFHFVVKWPMILADAGIALLLWWQARKRGLEGKAFRIGMAYALNPVSLLITCFHGSYSVLPAFFALLAYCLVSLDPDRRAYNFSALSLGVAIGLRAYALLFLPFFLIKMNMKWQRKAVFVILAGLPSLLTFAPFALVNFQAIWQNVFSYSGMADSGWIAAARTYWFLVDGNLYLPGTVGQDFLAYSKWLFLGAYGLFTVYFFRKRQRFSLLSGILGALLLFLGVYGGISVQYLIWVVPFALLVDSRWSTLYTWTAAGNLVFFYLFYFPGILFGNLPVAWPKFSPITAVPRLIFDFVFWVTCLAWFAWILKSPPADIAVEASAAGTGGVIEADKDQAISAPAVRRAWSWSSAGAIAIGAYICLVLVLELHLLQPRLDILIHPTKNRQTELVQTVDLANGGSVKFETPVDMVVDRSGNIYVANWANKRLQKFAPDGKLISEWQGDDGGKQPFADPHGLALAPDGETIWIMDSGNGWVYKVVDGTKVETAVDGAKLEVYNPRDLAVSEAGDIYIADTGRARILHLDPQGNLVAQWGSYGTGAGQFAGPEAIAVQGNDLFVVDVDAARIAHYNLEGELLGSWKVGQVHPWIAVDHQNWIYIHESGSNGIFSYDFNGNLVNTLLPARDIPFLDALNGFTVTGDSLLYLLGADKLAEYKIN
jgi:sugar lactone lactonase YvrE